MEDKKEINWEILNEIRDEAFSTVKGVGFHEEDEKFNLGDYLMNIHGEISELWESYRKNQLNEPCDKANKMSYPLSCLEEEVADIVLRVGDLCGKLGVDLSRACRVKNEFNKTRPHRNGGKVC